MSGMTFRALDSNGDWTFGSGVQNYLTAEAAINLNIKTRLYSWLGDCFFALNAGIDWANRLSKKSQKALLDQDTRRIITQSSGVTSIVAFNSTLNSNRAYIANYTVNTIYSPVTGNISIGSSNAQ